MCVSDLVLVLGLGGAAAYLWRTAAPGPRDRDRAFSSNSSSFLHWLFAEDKLTGDVLRNSVRARSRRNAPVTQTQLMLPCDSDSGLNSLVTNKNRPENVNETTFSELDLHYKVVSYVEIYNFVVKVEF